MTVYRYNKKCKGYVTFTIWVKGAVNDFGSHFDIEEVVILDPQLSMLRQDVG